MLASLVNENCNGRDYHLLYLCMANRSTIREGIGFSPNRLILGHEINLPLDVTMWDPPLESIHSC